MKRKYVWVAIAALVIVTMIVYLALQRDVLEALRAIPPWMAVLIVVVSGIALSLQSMQFRAAILINDIRMSLKESMALTAANTMANYYLPMRGGMVVRAAYMKRVYRFSLSKYAAVTISITGLTILVAAVLGLVGLGLIAATGGGADRRAVLTFVGVGVAAVAAVAIFVGISWMLSRAGRFTEIIQTFLSGMSLWVHAGGRLAVFLGWTVLLFAAQALRLWLSFRSVGVTVDVGSMLVIQAMAAVAFILALTPGNIGFKEGSVVFAASILGIDPEFALLASLIDRAAALITTFGVGLFSVRYLSNRTAIGSVDNDGADGAATRSA